MSVLACVVALVVSLVPPSPRRSATLDHLVPSRVRPTLSGPESLLVSPSGSFLVHYTTGGVDSTSASYATQVALWADVSREAFMSLGWLPPPQDGSSGGDARYDIYLMGLGLSLTGYTQVETSLPGGFPDDATSYVVLATGMTTVEAQAAVAHHVHQACQFAYSAAELGAWMEQTAGWMEEAAFPSADQWALRTGAYLGNAHKYLYVTDGWTEQGALLWPKYLAEASRDADLIRRIWLRCAAVAGTNTITATQEELASSGRPSLQREFQTFTSWNYLCGDRDDGLHYQEGDLITGSVRLIDSHTIYPATGASTLLTSPWGLGAAYVEFVRTTPGALRVWVDGADLAGPWGAGVIAVDGQGDASWGLFALDEESGQGDTTLTGWSGLQRVILVVQNLRVVAGTQGQFSYGAEVVSSAPPTAPTSLVASVSGDWVLLSWAPSSDPDGDLVGYHVYRSNRAFVPLGAMTRVAEMITDQDPLTPGVQWTDEDTLGADVVGDCGTNYVWVVTAVDAASNESGPSNVAGEFDFCTLGAP